MLGKLFRQNIRFVIYFILIVTVALLLRLINLGIIPVFGDEAIYIRWSQIMRSNPVFRFIPLSDGKQPLFMWVTIPFLKIFSDPLIAGRTVSVFTGLGTLVGVVTLSQLLFKSKKTTLFSGLLYAISPFSIFFDRLALADSMLTMFGIWTLIFLVVTVKKIRLDSAMLAGFSLGGSLLTKSPATFFSLFAPFTLLLTKWPKSLKNRFYKISVYVFLFTFTYVIAYGLYNILRLGPEFHMIGIRNKDYIYPLSHIFNSPLDPLKPFLTRNIKYLWTMGPSIFVLTFVYGYYKLFRGDKKIFTLLSIWGVLPIFIVSEFSKTMTARYIYFSVPYLIIIAAYTFRVIKYKNFFAKVLIAAVILQALYIDIKLITKPKSVNLPRSERSGFLEEWTSGYGIKEVSEYLKDKASEIDNDEKILVGTEGYFGTLPDGLQIYLNKIDGVEVIGIGQPIRKLDDEFIEKSFGRQTYVVVNSTRLLTSPNELGLELVKSYPKATRPEGTYEELLFFKLL